MPLPEVVYQSLCEATESLNTTRVSTSSSSSSSNSNSSSRKRYVMSWYTEPCCGDETLLESPSGYGEAEPRHQYREW